MQEKARVLLVDDEVGLLKLLTITLQKEYFTHITTATTKEAALRAVYAQKFDVILLDVMLPDGDGFTLCSAIRQHCTTPIIFVSARTSDFDKLTGLSVGGDDYITKPFNPLEVVARIRVILRRQFEYNTPTLPVLFQYGPFKLIPSEASFLRDGQAIDLTAKEYELLYFFFQHPNQVFTTSQIYEKVWGEEMFGEEKTVTIHIAKIRRKLNDDAKQAKLIVNLRGIGYKFVPPREV
ncbi:DNA-binding response regulator [Lysinibacillus alkalisoli]|uniref:DNA-binding response regulator n=1 Tax=Lysinibacillus alkalisoli TaxID=1911548 RepID=A0A917G9U4_9BACI|nr:response regulator transcription factor [Lysinibacillus alkalisoli]GGG30652.1 DNA-binding response regulator [Lysinibacillus alkalisoli]